MCTHDNYVSPYLRRPLRTYDEIMREGAERTGPENRSKARTGTVNRSPAGKAGDDGEPRQ